MPLGGVNGNQAGPRQIQQTLSLFFSLPFVGFLPVKICGVHRCPFFPLSLETQGRRGAEKEGLMVENKVLC